MRILEIDAALAVCRAAVVVDGRVTAARGGSGQGQAALLAGFVRDALAQAGIEARVLDAVAVTVGPGSFTGIRAGLSLAHGIALAAAIPVVGVSVGEAIAVALPRLGRRPLWVAIDSRRGRVFLERDGIAEAFALAELPEPDGPVALAGDAAAEAAAWLAGRGFDVMLTDARRPRPGHVAEAASRRLSGALPPRAPLPVYVDPPEAKLPAGGLRPPPLD